MVNKSNCTQIIKGKIVDFIKRGTNCPRIITVSYNVDGKDYQLRYG